MEGGTRGHKSYKPTGSITESAPVISCVLMATLAASYSPETDELGLGGVIKRVRKEKGDVALTLELAVLKEEYSHRNHCLHDNQLPLVSLRPVEAK